MRPADRETSRRDEQRRLEDQGKNEICQPKSCAFDLLNIRFDPFLANRIAPGEPFFQKCPKTRWKLSGSSKEPWATKSVGINHV